MTQKNWLNIQPDDNNKKLVKTIYCKLCCEYKNEICGLSKFTYIWPKDGCVHLQLSATVEIQQEDHKRLNIINTSQKRDWDLENKLQKLVDGKRQDKCLL